MSNKQLFACLLSINLIIEKKTDPQNYEIRELWLSLISSIKKWI